MLTTIHIHHRSNEGGQIRLAVDEQVDKGTIQRHGLILRDLHGSLSYHFHSSGRTGFGTLLAYGEEGLVQ